MKKIVWLVLVTVLALMPAGALLAQDAQPVLCGDLSEEDCALLESAAVADSEVTEASYSFVFDFLLSGVPDMPFEELALTWDQQATYVTDPNLADDMTAYLESLDPESVMDAEILGDVLGMIVDGIDTEQSFTVFLSEDTASMLSSEMDIALPTEFGLEYAMIDGIFYVNVSTLSALIPDLAQMPIQGWVGTDLAPILDLVLAEAGADSDAMAAMGPIGAILAGSMANSVAADADVEALNAFVEVTRVDDFAFDSEDAAVFETIFDFVAFASSPEFVEYAKAQMAAAAMMGIDVPSEEEMAQAEEMLPMVAPMVLAGLEYTMLQAVGLESNYTLGTDATLEWDLSTLADLDANFDAPDAYFGISMLTEVTDQNAVGEIAPPQGAFVVPAEMLMSMAGG